MNDARERLIEAVVAPLEGDDELIVIGRQQVGEILDPTVEESCMDATTSRLRKSGPVWWRWFGLALVLLVSLPMIHWALIKGRGGVLKTVASMNGVMYGLSDSAGSENAWRRGLSERDELLLFGAPGRSGADQWLPLWVSEPDNAAFYQEYVAAHLQNRDVLPPDAVETGDTLDPGNGWYRMLAALQEMELLVEAGSIPRSDADAGVAKSFTILDEEMFQERVELLHAACGAPRLHDYSGDLARQRFELMPHTEDMISLVQNYSVIVANQRFSSFFRGLRELVAAEAERCQKQGDKESFEALTESWQRLASARLDDSVVLVDGLLVQAFMLGTLPSIRDAAVALEVDGEKWTSLEKEARERKQRLSTRKGDDGLITQHGSYLGSLTLPMLQRLMEEPPPLTAELLLPSVRVDQAFVARFLSSLGWLILGVIVLVSLAVTAGKPRVIKLLARHLREILEVKDWTWIFFGGVCFPLLFFLGVRYGTPLSRLDWGPRLTLYLVPFGQMVALLLMWLVWPIILAVWRLEKRGEAFSWTLRKRILAVVAGVAPPVGMVLLGLGVPMGAHTLVMLGAACFAGVIALAWSLFWPGWGSPKGFGRRLQRATLLNACRPGWLAGMAGFALLSPFFAAEERRWMARDELLKPTPAMTAYESRATEQMVAELRALLETHFPSETER